MCSSKNLKEKHIYLKQKQPKGSRHDHICVFSLVVKLVTDWGRILIYNSLVKPVTDMGRIVQSSLINYFNHSVLFSYSPVILPHLSTGVY